MVRFSNLYLSFLKFVFGVGNLLLKTIYLIFEKRSSDFGGGSYTSSILYSSASRIENLASFSWLLRRQHPGPRKRLPSRGGKAKRRSVARLLPCKTCPFRYADDSPCRMGIIRSTKRAAIGPGTAMWTSLWQVGA
jgi:hypothetical protein